MKPIPVVIKSDCCRVIKSACQYFLVALEESSRVVILDNVSQITLYEFTCECIDARLSPDHLFVQTANEEWELSIDLV